MGADIYLPSVYEANHAQHYELFMGAVRRRDAANAEGDKATAERIQEEVSKHYNDMYAVGYFRDSYNTTRTFGVLGLSWWQLADELCTSDEESGTLLPIENAKVLLDRIEAIDFEAGFEKWVAECRADRNMTFDPEKGEDTIEDWKKYHQEKVKDFCDLLRQSIELNEPLRWSV